jgi:hypothetical protein
LQQKFHLKNEINFIFWHHDNDILENEFSEIIDYTIYFDELTDEEWEYTTELENSALEQYDEAFVDFDKFREGFAEEWDFSL